MGRGRRAATADIFGNGGLVLGGGGGVGGGGALGIGANGGSGGFGGGGGFDLSPNSVVGTGGVGGFGGGGGAGSGTGSFGGIGGFGGGQGDIGLGAGGGGGGFGGAIFNMGADSAHPSSGQATLINCTLFNNTAQGGSGTAAGGAGLGGALFNLDGQVNLSNDTLANNGARSGPGPGAATPDGGAVYNLAFGNDIDTGNPVTASLVFNNSILADSANGNHDLLSTAINGTGINAITVNGTHNLVMTSSGTFYPGIITLTADPDLSPPQDNGGPTPTCLPAAGSPVLGAGVAGLAPFTDQRGQPRPLDGPTDLGSVQVSAGSNTGGGSGSGGSSSSPHMPVGQLLAFAFGFVNNQLDIFFIDQKGQVFDETFTLNNFFSPSPANAQFLNTDMVMRNMAFSDTAGYPAVLGSLVDGGNQDLLMITVPLGFMSQAALQDMIAALQASGA